MELKRCKQCGILKDVECFRKYTYSKTKGTEGRFSICRECESINQTYRRAKQHCIDHGIISEVHAANSLNTKDALLYAQTVQIERLYAMLKSKGLKVPAPITSQQAGTAVDEVVKKLTDFYVTSSATVQPTGPSTVDISVSTDVLPDDLAGWLTSDWHDWQEQGMSPEYLQETVYESLKAKYRPQTGFDHDTGLPIYDDTYKKALNDILRRFDDYEDAMLVEEEEGSPQLSEAEGG